jgi:hypothetical protein
VAVGLQSCLDLLIVHKNAWEERVRKKEKKRKKAKTPLLASEGQDSRKWRAHCIDIAEKLQRELRIATLWMLRGARGQQREKKGKKRGGKKLFLGTRNCDKGDPGDLPKTL